VVVLCFGFIAALLKQIKISGPTMNNPQDIYVRAHTIVLGKKKKRTGTKNQTERVRKEPKWPEYALVLDCETRLSTQQELTFGWYRWCQLRDDEYVCAEEGIFYADDLSTAEIEMLHKFTRFNHPESTDDGCDIIKVYSRSEFMEEVFWPAIRSRALCTFFNAPFDLSRIAVGWTPADNGGWSFYFEKSRNPKTRKVEENNFRPRICVNSINGNAALISLKLPNNPNNFWRKKQNKSTTRKKKQQQQFPNGRFLDLHTLIWALRNKSWKLETACKNLCLPEELWKQEHDPTGRVDAEEIEYARQDVIATLATLNVLKREYDQHPIALPPDKAYSPASIGKAYLDAMGIIPPMEKFALPEYIHGIAMQSYFGGRAECRIRKWPVPVVPVDFTSQYPTVNTLLGNFDVLTAKSISIEDVTSEVRAFLAGVTLERTFDPAFWKRLQFFALVTSNNDILPVRTVYNDSATQNIGVNGLTSQTSMWFAGPDVIASILLNGGKVPTIEKAIRVVPHRKQTELTRTNLQGMVEIDPVKQDFYRSVVEQRKRFKSDKALAYFLKILANSSAYGLFVELNPKKVKSRECKNIKVFSGEHEHTQPTLIVEEHGSWLFPILAAFITSGGRLLLATLEQCVKDAGGSYLFCDSRRAPERRTQHSGF